jgi:hypothetical protein
MLAPVLFLLVTVMARNVDAYGGQILRCETVLSHVAVLLYHAASDLYTPLSSPTISLWNVYIITKKHISSSWYMA